MARSRTLLFVLLASASLTAAACKDNKPADTGVDAAPVTPSATPASSAAAPSGSADADAGDEHGKRAHGGPSAMLFQAARGLELTEAQKAKLDAAEKSAHEGMDAGVDGGAHGGAHGGAKEASKELHNALVAGIKAGKIETAKLEPHYAAIEKVSATERDKEASTLNSLHAALDPAQRKAVVASVRTKQLSREDRFSRMRERADAGGVLGAKTVGGGKRRVDRLVRGLELDAEQEKKVEAITPKDDAKSARPDPAEMRKHVEALLVAFEKDTFDAKKVDAFDAKQVRARLEGETKLLAQLVPILKPEQREKLAAKMERGPSPHGRATGIGRRPMMNEADDED